MDTNLGFVQVAQQGTPVSTCLSVVGTGSACQWAARGTFANVHRDSATGNVIVDSLDSGARTDPYMQTDFNLSHEVKVSKTHENLRVKFEGNITNLFNNRSATAFNQNIIAGSGLVNPSRVPRQRQVRWRVPLR